MPRTPVISAPHSNGDEDRLFGLARHIGNFHKTLPHDRFGEVIPSAYKAFAQIATDNGDFAAVTEGALSAPFQTPLPSPLPANVAKLVNPQCGRATDPSGPDPMHLEMQPAPGVLSDSAAAEFTELSWMALLRDTPFDTWPTDPDVAAAIPDLKTAFQNALADGMDVGGLAFGPDLPMAGGALRLDLQTLFRAGLPGEDKGPLVSQFLLQDFNYGAHLIEQTIVPYRAGRNHLTTHEDWLLAQSTGYDLHKNDYGNDNSFGSDATYYDDPPMPGEPLPRVRLRNMRDLARFVNRDALHQAYFNAALQLLNWNATTNAGNPYDMANFRQGGFGTLGGPNLLALVSEVATRALKVVWRQKWLVHRRLRPEAYGGLMQMQKGGVERETRAYGLPEWGFNTEAATRIQAKYGTRFLPMAYSAGSPSHPSYGAGHASVAGACVTILKAWFADTPFDALVSAAAKQRKDPGDAPRVLQPGTNKPGAILPDYTGGDQAQMTLHGELNKLAANVAMGRSMGGVHWRSDNTRSLRLGERVATLMLRRLLPTYAERPLSLSYCNFDGDMVCLEANGKVTVKDDPELTTLYSRA